MGIIVAELTKNLIIFRPDEDKKRPDDDYLFCIYDQYLNKVTEYISEDRLEEMGKILLTIKELDTNMVKKAASMVTPIIRKKKSSALGYRLFGFLLLMKLNIDNIASNLYARSLIELTDKIVDSEDLVAYRLGQYFLNELNYKVGLNKMTVDLLNNEHYFKQFYNILVSKLGKEKDIEKVYNDFIEEIRTIKIDL